MGDGTDNGSSVLPSNRYTPYHVPHRTEVAGFMTILHGDARFYNNIFVQQPIREDLEAYAKSVNLEKQFTFICGTKPYDGYPTEEAYLARFTPITIVSHGEKDFYYDHMPVYTGGNVYFNGAQPCDTEENYRVDTEHTVWWQLKETDGRMTLETNLYEFMPELETPFISTEVLGEAFEPEQKFENPDGTPIFFDYDYMGEHRGIHPLPGPFESKEAVGKILF